MIKTIVAILGWFVTVISIAQNTNNDLIISKLKGDYYVYTTYNIYKGTPMPANGMYLVTKQGVVLFDTPWDTTQFQPLLDSIQINHQQMVVMCIATHSHADRTGGLAFLKEKGVKTYTTKQTDSISKTTNSKRAAFLFEGDTIFNLGPYSFETYYAGHGHTVDNIVIWFEEDKVLYGGCQVKSAMATDLGYIDEANIEEWEKSIKKIKRKFREPLYIIPGHGDWSSNNSLDHTLKLLKEHKAKNKNQPLLKVIGSG